jgi:hypothetical protein
MAGIRGRSLLVDTTMMTATEIVDYQEALLMAWEGGGPPIRIGYDDATFDYWLAQGDKMLAYSRSFRRLFELAKTGEKYDER